MPTITPREGLVAARKLLETTWTQAPSLFGKEQCAATALTNSMLYPGRLAVPPTYPGHPVTYDMRASYREAQKLLLTQMGLDSEDYLSTDIFLWNDAEGRTKEEVLAAYDKAIEAAS